MKKQSLKSVLQFTKATLVNFNNRAHVKGGFDRTGVSCFEVCDTRDHLKCSW